MFESKRFFASGKIFKNVFWKNVYKKSAQILFNRVVFFVAVAMVAGLVGVTKVEAAARPTLGGALACNLSIENSVSGGFNLIVNQTGGEMMHSPFGRMYLNDQLVNPAALGAWPNFKFHFPEMKNGDRFKYKMSDISGDEVFCSPVTAAIPVASCKVKDSKGNDTDYTKDSFYVNKPVIFEVSASGGSKNFSYSWKKDSETAYNSESNFSNLSSNVITSFIITSFNTSGLHRVYIKVKDKNSLLSSFTDCYARVKEIESPVLVSPPDATFFGKTYATKWNGVSFDKFGYEFVAKAPAGAGDSPVVFVIDNGVRYITGTLGADENYHLSLNSLQDLKEGVHAWAAQVPNALSGTRSFYIDKTAPTCSLIAGSVMGTAARYDTYLDVYMSDNSVGVNGGLSKLYLKEVNVSEREIFFTFANWTKDFKISEFNPLKIYATGVKEGNQYKLTVKDVLENETSCKSEVIKIPPPDCVTNPNAPKCPPPAPVINSVVAVFPKSPSVSLPKTSDGRWAAPAWMKVRVKTTVTGADSCIIGGVSATEESGNGVFYADVSMPIVAPIVIKTICNNTGGSATKDALMSLVGLPNLQVTVLYEDGNPAQNVDVIFGKKSFLKTNEKGVATNPYIAWRDYSVSVIPLDGYTVITPASFINQLASILCKDDQLVCKAILKELNIPDGYFVNFNTNDAKSDTGFVFRLRKKEDPKAELRTLTATAEVTSGETINVSWTGSSLPASCAASANPPLGGWNNSVSSKSGGDSFPFKAPEDVTQETTYWLGLSCGEALIRPGDSKSPSVKVKPRIELKSLVVSNSVITSGDVIMVSWGGKNLLASCKTSSINSFSVNNDSALSGWKGDNVTGSSTGGEVSFKVEVDRDTSYQLGLNCGGSAIIKNTDGPILNVRAKPKATADLKVNGFDGPLEIDSAGYVKLTWSSTNAKSCVTYGGTGDDGWMTGVTGRTIALNNSSGNNIKVDGTRTFGIKCGEATDTVTVSIKVVLPLGQQSFEIVDDLGNFVTDSSVVDGTKIKFKLKPNGNYTCKVTEPGTSFEAGGINGTTEGFSNLFYFAAGKHNFVYSCPNKADVIHNLTVTEREFVTVTVFIKDTKGNSLSGRSVSVTGVAKYGSRGTKTYKTGSDGKVTFSSSDFNLRKGEILKDISLSEIDASKESVTASLSKVNNSSSYIYQVLGDDCGVGKMSSNYSCFARYASNFWPLDGSGLISGTVTNVETNDLSGDYFVFTVSDVPQVTADCSVAPASIEKGGMTTVTVSAKGGSDSYDFTWPNLSNINGSYSQAPVSEAMSSEGSVSFNTSGDWSFEVTIKDQKNSNLSASAGCSVKVTEPQVVVNPPPGVNCASVPTPVGCPGVEPPVAQPTGIRVGVVDATSGGNVAWGTNHPPVSVSISGTDYNYDFGGSGLGDEDGVSDFMPIGVGQSFNVSIDLKGAAYTVFLPASGGFFNQSLAGGAREVYIFRLVSGEQVVPPGEENNNDNESVGRWRWNGGAWEWEIGGVISVEPWPSSPCDGKAPGSTEPEAGSCPIGFTGSGSKTKTCVQLSENEWGWSYGPQDCKEKLSCLLSKKGVEAKAINIFYGASIDVSSYFNCGGIGSHFLKKNGNIISDNKPTTSGNYEIEFSADGYNNSSVSVQINVFKPGVEEVAQ